MANEIPQIQDAQPVLSPVNVNSGAQGYEEFAKTLGSLAGAAEQKTEEIVSDQSQSMYINSVANIEQIKTSAQINMLNNPDQAPKIAQQTANAMDEVKQAAFVNKKDRNRLNAYISGATDDVALKATATEVQQRQRQAAFTHYANWPDQLKAYQQALLTDHDKAETLKTAMIASLHNLVSIGALSPEQAGSGMKTMTDVVGLAQDHYSVYGNPNATAKDYHTVTSNPLAPGGNDAQAPINASTGWLVDYHNSDKTFQGVLADINNRLLPNPEAFDALQPAQRQHAMMAIQGARIADGYINSGEPFNAIQSKYDELNTKNKVLSYRDEATRNALGSYINQLKHGNYLSVMGQTPMGNAILGDFNMRNAAIMKSPIDDDKKMQMILQNKNKLVDESIAYGQGHHIPSEYIQPIPQSDVANVEQGFQLGKDPSTVLQTLGQYNKANQAYVANAMKNPDQRMVVNAVALSGDVIKPQDKLDFIAANQTGRNYMSKNIEGATNDKTLLSRISANLSPSLKIVSQNYDFEQAQTLQNSMLKTTLNYAKYLAYKDHNIGATDQAGFILSDASWKGYVDQASKMYATSFQQKSGSNWVVNPQQLPTQLSDSQLDVLADHVTNEGYKYLKNGRDAAEYQNATDHNPLRMVISPTNDLQAVDGNGKVYYTMPFTTNTVPFAQEAAKRREVERKKAISEAIERGVKQQLNVRLPEDANPQ
jgi:hypothetical protein